MVSTCAPRSTIVSANAADEPSSAGVDPASSAIHTPSEVDFRSSPGMAFLLLDAFRQPYKGDDARQGGRILLSAGWRGERDPEGWMSGTAREQRQRHSRACDSYLCVTGARAKVFLAMSRSLASSSLTPHPSSFLRILVDLDGWGETVGSTSLF